MSEITRLADNQDTLAMEGFYNSGTGTPTNITAERGGRYATLIGKFTAQELRALAAFISRKQVELK